MHLKIYCVITSFSITSELPNVCKICFHKSQESSCTLVHKCDKWSWLIGSAWLPLCRSVVGWILSIVGSFFWVTYHGCHCSLLNLWVQERWCAALIFKFVNPKLAPGQIFPVFILKLHFWLPRGEEQSLPWGLGFLTEGCWKKTDGANDGWMGGALAWHQYGFRLVVVLVTARLTLFSPVRTPCHACAL